MPKTRFPTLAAQGKITTPYMAPTMTEAQHPGVDIANEQGTPISSTTDGIVAQAIMGRAQGEENMGNSVIIKDTTGNTHSYGHLRDVLVRVGQAVTAGQKIATMGNTGAVYSKSGLGDGTHLDYRVMDKSGKPVDPSVFLQKYRG